MQHGGPRELLPSLLKGKDQIGAFGYLRGRGGRDLAFAGREIKPCAEMAPRFGACRDHPQHRHGGTPCRQERTYANDQTRRTSFEVQNTGLGGRYSGLPHGPNSSVRSGEEAPSQQTALRPPLFCSASLVSACAHDEAAFQISSEKSHP